MTLVRGIPIVWRLEGVKMCRVALMQLGIGEHHSGTMALSPSIYGENTTILILYSPQYYLGTGYTFSKEQRK